MKRGAGSKTAKLADVAQLALVSTATVSRALTCPDKVKPATAARVRQAVQALGYVAHGAARALASRRTHTIGAVIPTLDNAIFANTAHARRRPWTTRATRCSSRATSSMPRSRHASRAR